MSTRYDEIRPKILESGLEIRDFTTKMGEGKSRLDIFRSGSYNWALSFAHEGLLEIDNTIVPPGEEFSFIETINPTTNGLTKNGRGIGGGTCNSTTTIFRAALESGFPITERNPHTWSVPSYGWGYPENIVDAAYYTDPAVDFKFKNDIDEPLLLVYTYDQPGDGYQYNTLSIYSTPQSPQREVIINNWKIWDKWSDYTFKGSFDRIVKESGQVISNETFSSSYSGQPIE